MWAFWFCFNYFYFIFIEVADITHALSKLTEPAPVPIHKLSVTNMVHSAKKKIRKHRGVDESPLNNEVLNTILLVSCLCMLSAYKTCISCFHWCIGFIVYGRIINKGLWCQFFYLSCIYQLFEIAQVVTSLYNISRLKMNSELC